jgi:hypothetical protein
MSHVRTVPKIPDPAPDLQTLKKGSILDHWEGLFTFVPGSQRFKHLFAITDKRDNMTVNCSTIAAKYYNDNIIIIIFGSNSWAVQVYCVVCKCRNNIDYIFIFLLKAVYGICWLIIRLFNGSMLVYQLMCSRPEHISVAYL